MSDVRVKLTVAGMDFGTALWPAAPRIYEHIEIKRDERGERMKTPLFARVLRVIWNDDRLRAAHDVELICAWEPLGAPRPIEPA